jgi:hypothetical protein
VGAVTHKINNGLFEDDSILGYCLVEVDRRFRGNYKEQYSRKLSVIFIVAAVKT